MYLMVDNYDSFVYNLACYLEECGERVELVRNDKISAKEIEGMLKTGALEVRPRITVICVPLQIGKAVLLRIGFKNTLLV